MPLRKDRNDIIERALDLIGVKAAEEELRAVDIQDSAIVLDHMVKKWQADGAHLWSENEAFLFVQPGQVKYQLGDNSPDHATEVFGQTTLSGNAAVLDVQIALVDATGLLVGDNIGIKLNTGGLFWTTVINLAPITLNDSMPSGAIAGNVVYFYTTDIGKPLRIPDARRRQNTQDIEMRKLGRTDYLNQPNKNNIGTPVQFYYRPNINSGNLFLWPAPQNITTIIPFTYYRPLEVFDGADSAPDFPNEWLEPLVYNLALRRAPAYGMQAPQEVILMAVSSKEDVEDWDADAADIFFEVGSQVGG